MSFSVSMKADAMDKLLSVREAQEQIIGHFAPLSSIEIPLLDALGRVLAEQIIAPLDSPSFSNSGMDGFAVNSADVSSASSTTPITLKLVGDIPAGSSPVKNIEVGQAARIMTGAPLPPGADAVVPVEYTDAYLPEMNRSVQKLSDVVRIYRPVKPGEYVRHQGQDFRKGEKIFEPGRKLSPQDIGLLASLGYTKTKVHKQPKVALFSSGDELRLPGQALEYGQIYDANRFLLYGLLIQSGAQILSVETLPDDPFIIEQSLDRAIQSHPDFILTSAGVSVGAYDFVKQVIQTHGHLDLWRVNMRPGKPLAFGSYRGIPVIGLPGNPVSSFVGFLVFVLPILRKLQNLQPFLRTILLATLQEEVSSDGRESYLRARLDQTNPAEPKVFLEGHQGSANLYALTRANALLILPSGVKSLPAGAKVEVWPLDNMIR
ncbi:gephyrin-like molybdotransferase Glp [Anaerolinea thermolimosa]|uniref:molybdopterin molybdotransferase MoeA n=1 Tax=Anaerolinea thermolimosa TaxID=229919 RepID=UPI000782F18C|nr:gephyrin-like molybdotransferase Glp [Anaerolinea thermolimosa]